MTDEIPWTKQQLFDAMQAQQDALGTINERTSEMVALAKRLKVDAITIQYVGDVLEAIEKAHIGVKDALKF